MFRKDTTGCLPCWEMKAKNSGAACILQAQQSCLVVSTDDREMCHGLELLQKLVITDQDWF